MNGVWQSHSSAARAAVISILLLAICEVLWSAPVPADDGSNLGQKLASQLRSQAPTADSGFQAELKIRPAGKPTEVVPITGVITVLDSFSWRVTYEAIGKGKNVQTLSIESSGDAPNKYLLRENASDQSRVLLEPELGYPFAKSDFWAADLGMEFFHWPQQVLIKKEMRKGRGCRVLESLPQKTNYYSRVLTWIDTETDGILLAEAYGADGKLLKEFEVRSFRKVKGQYQLQEMEIRNVRTKSRTRLEFKAEG